MIITQEKSGRSKIKTKASTLTIAADGIVTINDLTLPGPGEYEVGDVFTEQTKHVAHYHTEDMVLVYLNDPSHPLGNDELAKLESIDIVLVRLRSGDVNELGPLAKAIGQIEPRVVILSGEIEGKESLKVEGQVTEPTDTVKLTRRDLPEEQRTIYLLRAA